MSPKIKQTILASFLALSLSTSMLATVAYADDTKNTSQNTSSSSHIQAKTTPEVEGKADVTQLPAQYKPYENWGWTKEDVTGGDLSANYAASDLVEAYVRLNYASNPEIAKAEFSNQYMNFLTASDATQDGKNRYAKTTTELTETTATLSERVLGQKQTVEDILSMNILGRGPVLKSDFYNDSVSGNKLNNDTELQIEPEFYVLSKDKVYGINSGTPDQNIMLQRVADVKNAVANYGGVSIDFEVDTQYTNSANNSIYRPMDASTTAQTQTGVIVGWDDAYLNTQFKEGMQPLIPGAFIVRSYDGTEYYYVSYTDHNIIRNDNEYVNAVVHKDDVKAPTERIMESIPDENLKAYLNDVLKVDANGDGNLSYGEIASVRNIDISKDVYNKNVDSLDGLGEFAYIESISARKQPIKTLFAPDFYYLREVDVAHSGLEELIPSYYNDIGTLQSIKVDHTNLFSLDLTGHDNLRTLSAEQTQMNNDKFKVTPTTEGTYQFDFSEYVKNSGGSLVVPEGATLDQETNIVTFDSRILSAPQEVILNANTFVNANDAQAQITGVDNNMKISILVYSPDVSVNEIENYNLRWYVLNRLKADKNNDGMLSYTERAAIKQIDVSYATFPFWVTSLKGIELFPNLESLSVRKQPITEVNTSANTNLTTLDIWRSAVDTLNIKNNTKLTDLNIYSNNLYTLDLSTNTSLKTVDTEQLHYNKTDIPTSIGNGKYEFNLSQYVGTENLSKVSFENTDGFTYDSVTGMITFDSAETAFNRDITYLYADGFGDHKTPVLLHMYPEA